MANTSKLHFEERHVRYYLAVGLHWFPRINYMHVCINCLIIIAKITVITYTECFVTCGRQIGHIFIWCFFVIFRLPKWVPQVTKHPVCVHKLFNNNSKTLYHWYTLSRLLSSRISKVNSVSKLGDKLHKHA